MAERNKYDALLYKRPVLSPDYPTYDYGFALRIDSVSDVSAGQSIRTFVDVGESIGSYDKRRYQLINYDYSPAVRMLVIRATTAGSSILGLVTSPESPQFGHAVEVKAAEMGIGQSNDGSFKRGVVSVFYAGEQDPSVVLAPFPQARAESVLRNILDVDPADPAASLAISEKVKTRDMQRITMAAQAMHALNGFPLDAQLEILSATSALPN